MLSVAPFVRLWLGVALAMGLILSAPVASAELLVSETFDYPVGCLHGQNGGIGFAGAWQAQGDLPAGQPTTSSWQEFRVQADPIAYPGYDALGRAIGTQTTSANSLSAGDLRQADRPIVSLSSAEHDTLYLGFSYVKTGAYGAGTGSSVLELIDSARPGQSLEIGHSRLGVSSPVIGPDGQPTGGSAYSVHFHLSLGETRSMVVEPFSWHTSSTGGLNVPYFMLVKLVFMEDVTVALLSYTCAPDALPTEDPLWDVWVGVDPMDLNIDTLRVHAQSRNYAGRVDDIRIGSTLQDVLLVPEPASLSLLGLAGLLLGRKR